MPAQFVSAHRGEARGGEASPAGAVRISAELAGSDPRLQGGRQGCGRERENAVLGAVGRRGELPDHDFGHIQLGILLSQLRHISDGLRARSAGLRISRKVVADLGSEHAEPHTGAQLIEKCSRSIPICFTPLQRQRVLLRCRFEHWSVAA